MRRRVVMHLSVTVEYDDECWFDSEEVFTELGQRLFTGNDDYASEALEVIEVKS